MSEETELKPCPFCGEKPHLGERDYNEWNCCALPSVGYWIECLGDDCKINPSTGDEEWDAYQSKEEAWTAWNVRQPATF